MFVEQNSPPVNRRYTSSKPKCWRRMSPSAWVAKQRGLKPIDRLVLERIAEAANAHTDGVATILRQTIADKIEVSLATVDRAICRLVAMGLIEKQLRWRKNGNRTACAYLLVGYAERPEIWEKPKLSLGDDCLITNTYRSFDGAVLSPEPSYPFHDFDWRDLPYPIFDGGASL